MPLREDIEEAIKKGAKAGGDGYNALNKILQGPEITSKQLVQALVTPDDTGWTLLEYWAQFVKFHDQKLDHVAILLSAVFNHILESSSSDPDDLHAAKICIKNIWASLHPKRNSIINTHILGVFLDYIFNIDFKKPVQQRIFTDEEVFDYIEIAIEHRDELQRDKILQDIGMYFYTQWITSKSTKSETKSAEIEQKKVSFTQNEKSQKQLTLSIMCFSATNDPQRFACYNFLMQRDKFIDESQYKSLSDFLKSEEITPDAFSKLFNSPLVETLKKQADKNALIASELGELYLWAWRFAIPTNASSKDIAMYLEQAVFYLSRSLFIEPKKFPERALQLLEEIHDELTTEEILSLDTEESDVTTKTEQIKAKAAGTQEWLARLKLLSSAFQAQAALHRTYQKKDVNVDNEEIRMEIKEERRKAAIQKFKSTESKGATFKIATLEEKEPTKEELEQAAKFLPRQDAIKILINSLTEAPEIKESKELKVVRVQFMDEFEPQIPFRFLEYLASSDEPYANLARTAIINFIKQKYGPRPDPTSDTLLPADSAHQLPHLTHSQAILFLHNSWHVEYAFYERENKHILLNLLETYLKQYLHEQKQEQKSEEKTVDPIRNRTIAFALNVLINRCISSDTDLTETQQPCLQLTLEILQLKLRDPNRYVENLPEVPDTWVLECFSNAHIKDRLTPQQKFSFLKYLIDKNNGHLNNEILKNLLDNPVDPNYILEKLLTAVTNGDWHHTIDLKAFQALYHLSSVREYFDKNPLATIKVYFKSFSEMDIGERSDTSYFANYIFEHLNKKITLEDIFKLINTTKNLERLILSVLNHVQNPHSQLDEDFIATADARNFFILECVKQNKVSTNFAIDLYVKLREKPENENTLKQQIFQTLLARYPQMSQEEKTKFDDWVMEPPFDMKDSDDQKDWVEKRPFTRQRIENIIAYLALRVANNEAIIDDIGVIYFYSGRIPTRFYSKSKYPLTYYEIQPILKNILPKSVSPGVINILKATFELIPLLSFAASLDELSSEIPPSAKLKPIFKPAGDFTQISISSNSETKGDSKQESKETKKETKKENPLKEELPAIAIIQYIVTTLKQLEITMNLLMTVYQEPWETAFIQSAFEAFEDIFENEKNPKVKLELLVEAEKVEPFKEQKNFTEKMIQHYKTARSAAIAEHEKIESTIGKTLIGQNAATTIINAAITIVQTKIGIVNHKKDQSDSIKLNKKLNILKLLLQQANDTNFKPTEFLGALRTAITDLQNLDTGGSIYKRTTVKQLRALEKHFSAQLTPTAKAGPKPI